MAIFKHRNSFNKHRYFALVFLTLTYIFCQLIFTGKSFADCGTPGNDGTGPPSGVINTYYPGTASVSAGATSIPVGSPLGSGPAIAAGDLLLIIQMQDADINYSNNSSYGSGSGTGRGSTNLNQTGYYEFARASGAVAGGFVGITSGLTYSYRNRAASGTNGQSRYQVIRVPQYSSATVSGTVSALNWNGSVGGVVAMDVAGTLTINGTVTANGAGFRGGYGRSINGGTGANTDYRTSYTNGANGSKGEGIAGTPYYMNRPATFDGVPVQVTGGSGYPDGTNSNASYARGAPGNAGGGGTDADAANNDENTGGGGGGNYAAGAKGGNSWSTNLTTGGEGGDGVTGLAFNLIVMGGGGGAGTSNNGTADNSTYLPPTPPGIACNSGAGACSSGAPGGGIVIIRANYITGSGTITANGGSAYNVLNDSSGGGGAGGSIVIYSYTGGSASASVNGGNGGNAWRSQAPGATYPGERHGPGGGGSGGFIAYSPSTLGIAMSYAAGVSGRTTTANDTYGSTSSSGGYAAFDSSAPPGIEPGADCVLPSLEMSTKTWVDLNGGDQNPGDVIRYTITLIETHGVAANNVVVTDNIPANVNSFTVVSIPAGATNNSASGGGANGTGYLNITGINVPAGGSVTIVFDVTINTTAASGTTINNMATVTPPTGFGATPTATTITVTTGTTPTTGNKPLYLWRDTATTGHLYRSPQGVSANYVTIARGGTTVTWALSPVLQSAVNINSGNIPVNLWLATNNTRTYTMPITLRCGGTAVATVSGTAALTNGNPPALFTYNLPLAAPYTCAAGSAWSLSITNNQGTGAGARDIRVYPSPTTGNYSYVNLNSQNVINVDSVGFYSAAYPPAGTALTYVYPGQAVIVRAMVSDPFGAYDITGATVTITNPAGVVQSPTPVAMTENTNYSNAGSKMYEYAYTIPAGAAAGTWVARVDATEGTEGAVTDYGLGTIPVIWPPNLTIVKSASANPVSSGQTVTYSIVVTNTGTGNAINARVTDPLPQYTTYVANSTRLNGITVAGDGATLPLIAGILIDDNSSRSAGAAATGILPPYSAGPPVVGRATITFQVTIN